MPCRDSSQVISEARMNAKSFKRDDGEEDGGYLEETIIEPLPWFLPESGIRFPSHDSLRGLAARRSVWAKSEASMHSCIILAMSQWSLLLNVKHVSSLIIKHTCPRTLCWWRMCCYSCLIMQWQRGGFKIHCTPFHSEMHDFHYFLFRAVYSPTWT